MKIGIIGAGISGLTIGKLLNAGHDVKIYERSKKIGGIARAKMVDGIPYHVVGGHCLNSKNTKVLDFVYKHLSKDKWHSVDRVAKILFKGNSIDYPIEFSMRQIAKFDEDLAFRITYDFFSSTERTANNLDEWFRINFGNSLAEEYLIPYNAKIWGKNPVEMSPDWVQGKLPMPNKKQFFKGLLGTEKDAMPHATFNYPNSNTQNDFIDALGHGLVIETGYNVQNIERSGSNWIINGENRVDLIVSTMPLNILPFIIQNVPNEVRTAAELLKYNKISNMLWETEDVNATWTYCPDPSTIFHRHIHIGNFLTPKSNNTITEVIGDVSPEIMEREGRKFDYLKKPIDCNTSDHAYVVFDHNYNNSVNIIKNYLKSIGITTLGRFGEWEYYNMDVCIESAMRIAEKIVIKEV